MKTQSNLTVRAEWALRTTETIRGLDRVISVYSIPSMDQVFMDIKEAAFSGKTGIRYLLPMTSKAGKDPIPQMVKTLEGLGYTVRYEIGELNVSWVKVR